MQRKKNLVCTTSIVLVALYLMFSTSIINHVLIQDSLRLTKTKDKLTVSEKGFYGGIDGYAYLGGIKEELSMIGWGFQEASKNQEKRFRVFFAGEKGNYMTAPITPYIRTTQKTATYYNSAETINGFQISLPTIALPNGTYKLYVCLEYNGEIKGVVDSGRVFEKNGVKGGMGIQGEKVSELASPKMDTAVSTNVNVIAEQGKLCVTGTAYIPDKNSKNQKVYIKVQSGTSSSTFSVGQMNDLDNSEGISPTQLYTGISFCQPQQELPGKSGTLSFFVEQNNVLYSDNAVYNYEFN